ncbi:hypothetical protein XH91_32790 [Bradyrhizobium guangzhouense]|uniref:EVE domain-containing protein n=2 Tax=Bradyrhizobium guangzhouense TaxID=1325095 RepID=A0AAE6CBG0_9BRAD|nr:hypothetical protein XH91_32790 [Bradyrhizobium guangzhouense]
MVAGENNSDWAKLDADGFDTWKGHPRTKVGDLILMYRTAPYSDIACIFTAISDARATVHTREFPWKVAVDPGGGFRLRKTIKLTELKDEPRLAGRSFLKKQQGATSRKLDLEEQGAWRGLRKILEDRNPGLKEYLLR